MDYKTIIDAFLYVMYFHHCGTRGVNLNKPHDLKSFLDCYCYCKCVIYNISFSIK